MTPVDPALFYTGLVADLYAPLRSEVPDPQRYAQFIRRSGQPALELACGDGDPLLDLRAMGLDVDGVDSSPDMIERCRRRAADQGVEVTLHVARMENMNLDRRYRSIFLAGASFNLLPDDMTAGRAIRRIRTHLEPGGTALIPLEIPSPTPPSRLGVPRTHEHADGTVLSVTPVREAFEKTARRRRTVLRYERTTTSGTETEEREWLLHWYTADGFRSLVEEAGLTVIRSFRPDGGPPSPDANVTVMLLGEATVS